METETPAESIVVDEAQNQSFLSFKFGALTDLEKSVIFQQLRTRLWTIWTRGERRPPRFGQGGRATSDSCRIHRAVKVVNV